MWRAAPAPPRAAPGGTTAARGDSAMLNLIGALPDPEDVRRVEGAHLHLYGKAPRPGRKLGHVTVTASSPEERDARLATVEAVLSAARVAPAS